MGTIRFVEVDGELVGLYDHEGDVARVFEDGSCHAGGAGSEVDARTGGFLAACSCGWSGEAFVPRAIGDSAWPEWETVPALEAEWDAHTEPHLAALARQAALKPTVATIVGQLHERHGVEVLIPPGAEHLVSVRGGALVIRVEEPIRCIRCGYRGPDHLHLCAGPLAPAN